MIFFISLFFPCVVFAQLLRFSPDAIPLEGDSIIFRVEFNELDLETTKIQDRILYYLTNELVPDSIHLVNYGSNKSVCQVVDRFNYNSGALQTNIMCMLYELAFEYKDNSCKMTLHNIEFMEKEEYIRMLTYLPLRSWLKKNDFNIIPAKKIMVDKSFKAIFVRRASEKITQQVLEKINNIIKDIESIITTDEKNFNIKPFNIHSITGINECSGMANATGAHYDAMVGNN